MGWQKKLHMPSPEQALPGRAETMPVPEAHFVNGNPLQPPFPDGYAQAMFGLGCFWGAERCFWQTEGVFSTAVGYAGGLTPNPTYVEIYSDVEEIWGDKVILRLTIDTIEHEDAST